MRIRQCHSIEEKKAKQTEFRQIWAENVVRSCWSLLDYGFVNSPVNYSNICDLCVSLFEQTLRKSLQSSNENTLQQSRGKKILRPMNIHNFFHTWLIFGQWRFTFDTKSNVYERQRNEMYKFQWNTTIKLLSAEFELFQLVARINNWNANVHDLRFLYLFILSCFSSLSFVMWRNNAMLFLIHFTFPELFYCSNVSEVFVLC